MYTSAADGSIIVWDIEGAGGVARRVAEPVLPRGSQGTVWSAPPPARLSIVDGPDGGLTSSTSRRRRSDRATIDEPFDTVGRPTAPTENASSPSTMTARCVCGTSPTGSCSRPQPGRGVDNRGAVAFTADGSAVVVADADGTVTELDGRTLEPTGRTLDVGIEPRGIRTASARRSGA